MEKLRQPLFWIAAGLMLLTVLVEVGSTWVVKGKEVGGDKPLAAITGALRSVPGVGEALAKVDPEEMNREVDRLQDEKPPGVGIPFMAWLDGLILFTVGLMGASFLLGERLHGRVQGIISLVVSFLVVIGTILLIFATLAKVLLMVGLFLAVPFGTIAYMAIWGFFNRAGAEAALGLLLVFKLGFAACLVLAHQRFLQNKGLVLVILTSLLANLVVGFLHGVVPGPLVSITDGVAGLVVLILALIWAIVMLVGAIISVIKAIA